ncbi:hypothetical protein BS78_K245200, partial [Paspalum vaginatum]
MLVGILGASLTYMAGLKPPGGMWREDDGNGHSAGNPVLYDINKRRYNVFFYSNSISFVASITIIGLLLGWMMRGSKRHLAPLHTAMLLDLLALLGAYAAGSDRQMRRSLKVLMILPIVMVVVGAFYFVSGKAASQTSQTDAAAAGSHDLDKTRKFVQLLAILAATVAYQAGLDPPGGVWAEGEAPVSSHRVGDPILLTTHPVRYKVFFYFNSGAQVASLVIMVILQNEFLVRRHALEAAMILDLFGPMGAYAAGSCRDTSSSIYTVALAGGVLIYVVIHIVFFTLDPASGGKKRGGEEEAAATRDDRTEKKREVLLLLAILAATLTYQAGLTPPGGFWEKDGHGHSAGSPVLQDMYPRRYKAFFYCNAASFMASVALIVLLLNPNLYRPGIKCYALFVCMVAGMFSLIGAYAAGSSLHLRTSIIVLILVTAVIAAVVYVEYIRRHPKQRTEQGQVYVAYIRRQPTNNNGQAQNQNPDDPRRPEPGKQPDMMAKYLMLVGILAASVTYLTGLKPPGGLWRDNGGRNDAGNPVLYDIRKHRYNAFFYSNSTSFMASVTVIALLLSRMIRDSEDAKPLWPMHTAMLLDMLALLGAYAAGSARDWGTSKNIVMLLFPVLGFVALLFFWKKGGDEANDAT